MRASVFDRQRLAADIPVTFAARAALADAVVDEHVAGSETQWFASVVSAEDRPLVEQYLSALRTLEAKLGNIQ